MAAPLLLHIEGPLATIAFNRSERCNALTFDMCNHLQRLFVDVKKNPQVRVIVMRDAGQEAFATVADSSECETRRNNTLAASSFDTEDFQTG